MTTRTTETHEAVAAAQVRCDLAVEAADLDEVRGLWERFRAWLAGRYAGEHRWLIEAYFDDVAWRHELESLPGDYHESVGGGLIIARIADRPIGTVAMRSLGGGRCEMKRMYVDEAGRGRGIADLLVESIVRRAGELGHEEMLLDTGFRQHEATRLYRKHGFTACEPYEAIDPDLARGLTFMRRDLVAE